MVPQYSSLIFPTRGEQAMIDEAFSLVGWRRDSYKF